MPEPRRILFVDDEPNVLDNLRRMLRRSGDDWELHFAGDVADAWARLQQTPFDVVVTDVKMPGRSGLELLADIKGNEATRDVEVVVLTGLLDRDLKRQALELGAADLLNKPVLREDLLVRLRSVLRVKAYLDDLQAQKGLLEQQLIESQKMEVVGVLAAGVTHDLNNILSVMVGYTDITTPLLSELPKAQANLLRIANAGNRAKRLVERILDLSRQQAEAPRLRFDLAQVIEESLDTFAPCFGKQITVQWDPGTDRAIISSDPIQMVQVLMNLCLNAVQAMDSRGVLSISLQSVRLDEDSLPADRDMHSGDYVLMSVSDTGPGLEAAQLEQIFDYGFTSKAASGGSGLGLFVVKTIVDQHGGMITVDSHSGQGTTFKVYLPCRKSPRGDAPSLQSRRPTACGGII